VGHIAFAYLSSKASGSLLKTKFNIPLILTLSVIPDIDILFSNQHLQLLEHRGPTHSVITALLVFTPFFMIYRKRAVPYFIALVQHSLVGDYIAGGKTQLLWPITAQYFGLPIDIRSSTNVTIEWTMFLASMIIMLKSKDVSTFFRRQKSNLILIIPTSTVLLPPFLSYPLDVPAWLIPPHIFYIAIFSAAILIELPHVLKPAENRSKIPTSAIIKCYDGAGGLLPRTTDRSRF
jgi:membrane-bound metal-dependent hydrolase YbcI (DUF457 family)